MHLLVHVGHPPGPREPRLLFEPKVRPPAKLVNADFSTPMLLLQLSFLLFIVDSAAYGALFKWELAEKDAQECVKRNPKFAKGYHRLANAQSQLGRKKEAIETLKTALTTATDPEKAPGIKKLLRQLNQELAAKSAAPAQGGGRQVPAHIAKELQELQPQFQKIQRELEQIEAKLAAYARQRSAWRWSSARWPTCPKAPRRTAASARCSCRRPATRTPRA